MRVLYPDRVLLISECHCLFRHNSMQSNVEMQEVGCDLQWFFNALFCIAADVPASVSAVLQQEYECVPENR